MNSRSVSRTSLLTQKLLLEAETSLPRGVEQALRTAMRKEKNSLAKLQLKTILENVALARCERAPLCQDTGFLEFFVETEKDFAAIEEGIRVGVKAATRKIPLRANSVDAFTRKPFEDNEPLIHFIPSRANRLTVFVKGAGSENKTALFMLAPSQADSLEETVLRFVKENAAQACPPVFVGVGIGGSAEGALALAKKALLREKSANGDARIARIERSLLARINKLGIGVMGLGGATTALGVRVETALTHTACLPLAIALNCWALRKASARLK